VSNTEGVIIFHVYFYNKKYPKLIVMNHNYKNWLIQAPLGLVIVGLGACLIAEAAMTKYTGGNWFWYGTLALVVFNSGLCIFGNSILHRVRYEQKQRNKK
jgi:peptidoglycan/LPS O-acetylase OafA/YrhL